MIFQEIVSQLGKTEKVVFLTFFLTDYEITQNMFFKRVLPLNLI